MSTGGGFGSAVVLCAVCLVGATASVPAQCASLDTKLTASDAEPIDGFGFALDFSGGRMVIGAPGDDDVIGAAGAAYVFERQGGSWFEVAKLTLATPMFERTLGRAVGVSGDTIVLSSIWMANVFELRSGIWEEVANLQGHDSVFLDQFSWSVAIEGDVFVAGAPGDNDLGASSGAAYVFERDAGGLWNETIKLHASDGGGADGFGLAVDIANGIIVVGAEDDDDPFGFIGGSAYVFERDAGGQWVQTAKLLPSDGASFWQFGSSVAAGRAGAQDLVLVGARTAARVAPSGGAAYVYERDGAGGWTETAILDAFDTENSDLFGNSVALSGPIALIGARGGDDRGINSGSAYVFVRQDDASWVEVEKIVPDDGATRDWFGWAVAIDGSDALISAYADDDLGTDSGSAYVFDISACAPCPADIDGDGDADVGDFFAFVLAFAAGDPAADVNGDGSIDVGDFFAFVAAFAAGCP